QGRQDEGRSAFGCGAQGVVDVEDSGEDERGVESGGASALDVRVEPVADHERPMRAEAAGGEFHHVRGGFADDDRLGLGQSGDEVDEGAVARDSADLGQQRVVGVARPPFGSGADDPAGEHDLVVVDVRVEPLCDGHGCLVDGVGDLESRGLERDPQTGRAEEVDPGAGAESLGQAFGQNLRRGGHFLGRRVDAQTGDLLSGGLGGAGGVVRHIVDADRALVQPADAVDGPVDRLGAVVDDAVEVEQDAVDRPARGVGRGSVFAVHLLDDAGHWSPSASASARISSSSASISSSVTLTDFSSFAEMCVVDALTAAAGSGSGAGSLFASEAVLGAASADSATDSAAGSAALGASSAGSAAGAVASAASGSAAAAGSSAAASGSSSAATSSTGSPSEASESSAPSGSSSISSTVSI